MKLTILSPGPLTTIQDAGRFGALGKGFSPGGAMDTEAMTLANLLVGNAPGVGVLEMTRTSYGTWMKFVGKFLLFIAVVTMVVLAGATIILY